MTSETMMLRRRKVGESAIQSQALDELRNKIVAPLLERAMKGKRNETFTQKERNRLQGVTDALRLVSIYLEDVCD